MTYRGPNVSVRQQFELSPPAVAIDNLAPVSIGTAYDVYSKELLDQSEGLTDVALGWIGDNPVVYNREVAGDRVYEFYPAKVFIQTDDFGAIDITDDVTIADTGTIIGAKQTYDVPGAASVAGQSKAIMPFYKNNTAEIAEIKDSNKDMVFMNGVDISGVGLVKGQKVFMNISTTWTVVGTVSAILQNGSVIKLAKAYSAEVLATNVTGITVGAASTTALDTPNTIFDPSKDFSNLLVKSGDIVEFELPSVVGTQNASVFSVVNSSTLFINTVAPALNDGGLPEFTLDIKQVETFDDSSLGGTAKVTEYKIKKLAGYSKNLDFKGAGGIQVTAASTTSITIPKNATTLNLATGYKVAFTATDVYPDTLDAGFVGYTIEDIIDNGADLTMVLDADPSASVDDYVSAWKQTVVNDILSDYRSIRSEEEGVRHRIASPADITNYYSKDEEISVYNDLAMMLFIQLSISGSAVYGVNVNAASDNVAAEYAAAFEEMKMVDVYSHALGTTDAGVNALLGPYCNSESEPYQGHERIGIVSYDELDVYNIGTDGVNASTTATTLVVDGALDLLDLGVTVGDVVIAYASNGDELKRVNVTLTPTTSTSVEVDGDVSAAITAQFLRGNKQARAEAIRNIKYGNRRIKVVWPGWFQADFNDETLPMVPPYYIAAAITGYDSLVNPSQSLTNFSFGIPGFSNYVLDTNFYFKKEDLDIISGGGVDIMMQDSQISQTIYSRHSLTSNMDAIEFREWSITKQADVASKTYRTAYKPYPGKYNITPELLQFLRTIGDAVSKSLGDKRKKIVFGAQITSITEDKEIKDKINLLVDIIVYVAGNYYDITLNIKS